MDNWVYFSRWILPWPATTHHKIGSNAIHTHTHTYICALGYNLAAQHYKIKIEGKGKRNWCFLTLYLPNFIFRQNLTCLPIRRINKFAKQVMSYSNHSFAGIEKFKNQFEKQTQDLRTQSLSTTRQRFKLKKKTDSWFKENLTAFARVWSSSTNENVALLGSCREPSSITFSYSATIKKIH